MNIMLYTRDKFVLFANVLNDLGITICFTDKNFNPFRDGYKCIRITDLGITLYINYTRDINYGKEFLLVSMR